MDDMQDRVLLEALDAIRVSLSRMVIALEKQTALTEKVAKKLYGVGEEEDTDGFTDKDR